MNLQNLWIAKLAIMVMSGSIVCTASTFGFITTIVNNSNEYVFVKNTDTYEGGNGNWVKADDQQTGYFAFDKDVKIRAGGTLATSNYVIGYERWGKFIYVKINDSSNHYSSFIEYRINEENGKIVIRRGDQGNDKWVAAIPRDTSMNVSFKLTINRDNTLTLTPL